MRLISKVQTMKIGTDASNFHDCQKCTPCAGDAPTRRLTRAPCVDTVGPFRRTAPAGGANPYEDSQSSVSVQVQWRCKEKN